MVKQKEITEKEIEKKGDLSFDKFVNIYPEKMQKKSNLYLRGYKIGFKEGSLSSEERILKILEELDVKKMLKEAEYFITHSDFPEYSDTKIRNFIKQRIKSK